jgi:hypothetical protein
VYVISLLIGGADDCVLHVVRISEAELPAAEIVVERSNA